MRSYAQIERQALCDTALRVGPEAATLCAGWTVRDLMAHLVIRERRPEAVGILLPQAHDAAERTRRRFALRPFEDLVDMVRKGPHELSPFRLKAVDARLNLSEYVIHHEDILRAQLPGADERSVRHLPDEEQSAIYDILPRVANLSLRHAAGRIAAQCPGRAPLQLSSPDQSSGRIVIVGEPSEILLNLAGRMSFVTFEGDADEVNKFVSEPRGY